MKQPRMYARPQAALVKLTQDVLANTDMPTLLRRATALVAHTLAVAYSAAWEFVPDRGALVLRAGVGWRADAVDHTTMAVAAASPISLPLLTMTAVTVADWPSETRFQQVPLLHSCGVISSMYVVIPGQVHPFGSLSVDVTASRIFSDEEMCFLQAVANLLALAVTGGQTAQDLEQRLIAAAQEQAVLEERQRLARDLHDSVTQSLYGITLHAQAATRLLAVGEVGTATNSLRMVQDTAQEALDEMRLLIFELRPPILEEIGLVAAIQARLNAVEGRANLQTRLIADKITNLPSFVEQALYRITLEALNNVLKHAHARCITVQLAYTAAGMVLEIRDDGVGFNPSDGAARGVGLRGIAERVTRLGGTLMIQSAPDTGTLVRVEITL